MQKQRKSRRMNLFFDIQGWKIEGKEHFLKWLEEEYTIEKESGEINFIIVDNDTISEMNKDYLDHEGATDVISFNLDDDDDIPSDGDETEINSFPVGEVYISLDRAQEQAKEYKVSLTNELSRLAIHGMLHIAGWEDDTSEKRAKMSKREDESLNRADKDADRLIWQFIQSTDMED
jgi:probable rRNA maturation factor